ncbi:hypothetical protein KIN20_008908, partial [Parelaphostrongylus tenuis]
MFINNQLENKYGEAYATTKEESSNIVSFIQRSSFEVNSEIASASGSGLTGTFGILQDSSHKKQ